MALRFTEKEWAQFQSDNHLEDENDKPSITEVKTRPVRIKKTANQIIADIRQEFKSLYGVDWNPNWSSPAYRPNNNHNSRRMTFVFWEFGRMFRHHGSGGYGHRR